MDAGERHEVVNQNGFVTSEEAARLALQLAIAADDALQCDLRLDWVDLLRGAEVWANLAVMLSVVGPTHLAGEGAQCGQQHHRGR